MPSDFFRGAYSAPRTRLFHVVRVSLSEALPVEGGHRIAQDISNKYWKKRVFPTSPM
jgi:hypothetical protein